MTTLEKTTQAYLSAFATLSVPTFLSILSPTAIHEFAPSSISPPPPKTPTTFAAHINELKEILSGFPVTVKELFVNEEKGEVTVWATSETQFRKEIVGRDNKGMTEEEWKYRGEYIFVLVMDESRERIVRVVEFLDSGGTQRLRGLVARAKEIVSS